MDQNGLLHQFLPPEIKPIRENMVVVGKAMPVMEADADTESALPLADKPFGLMLEALDDLKTDEVYICSGASPRYALWGELMSTRAMKLGAAGAVVNGYSRDTKGVVALGFPTFSWGNYAQDQAPRGKVVAFRERLTIGNVQVEPGDLIFGDLDGVCVVPKIHTTEILQLAMEKATAEKTVKRAIEEGMSACEAFKRYGVM